MSNRIVGVETEFALMHFAHDVSGKKGMTGTEIFELMNGLMDDAEIVRLYEEKFYPENRGEPFSSFEDRRRYSMKRNRMFLGNGARFYLDTGDHPEFATPECRTPSDLVAFEKAGEMMVDDLGQRCEQYLRNEGIGGEIFLCKNNIDVRGNTFGCHENYLIPRQNPRHNESSFFKLVIRDLIPFLVSRHVICGSGKVMTGNKLSFQISQRADFIDSELSSDTTFRRGIINSRDEPLSRIDKYRRLHILIGDSNMSEYATFIKVGTTMLVLDMIEGKGCDESFALEDPILALREISHDPGCRIKVKMLDGSYLSAIEIQRYYLNKVQSYLEEVGELDSGDNALILKLWKRTLKALEENPSSLISDVDWVAKKWITDRFLDRNNTSYSELNKWVYFIKRMKSLKLEESMVKSSKTDANFSVEQFLESRLSPGDLAELRRHVKYSDILFNNYFKAHRLYHNLLKIDIMFHDIRKDRGLFYKMRSRGLTSGYKFTDMEKRIEKALTTPPGNTRAKIRGEFVKLLKEMNVKGAVNWDSVSVHDVKLRKINLMNPFNSSNSKVSELMREIKKLANLGGKR